MVTKVNAKIVQHHCISCNERIDIDFNVDDYSTEITVVNGKKTEKRRFGKKSMLIFLIRSVKESAVP